MADASTSAALRVLILDDEATIRTTLSLCLEAAGHHVAAYGTSEEALDAAEKQVFDLLFLDVRLGTENGLELIQPFRAQSPWLKIIVITAYASIDSAVEAMRRGALDYLPKPFTPEHVEMLATKVAELRAMEFRQAELLEAQDLGAPPMLWTSGNRYVQGAWQVAKIFAASKAAVLIQGENGTGRRTLARAIHGWSPRHAGPFRVYSARGGDEKVLAGELFGQAGESSVRERSVLEFCSGGTLYLEDLPALPARLQLKLSEFLQNGRFEREESFEQVEADVRLVAGTSQPLAALAEAGLFRQDLFYALSAKAIELPPLRERMEDFEALVEGFMAFYGKQAGKNGMPMSGQAMEYLRGYAWPGNLRELQNVIERGVLLAQGGARGAIVDIHNLPPNLGSKGITDSKARIGDLVPLETIEELHIRGVLAATQSLETAAQILGIDYATLWRRRKKYGL